MRHQLKITLRSPGIDTFLMFSVDIFIDTRICRKLYMGFYPRSITSRKSTPSGTSDKLIIHVHLELLLKNSSFFHN